MPERAKVTSVEAIEMFRNQLIVYLGKARPALDEVSADLVRMRLWLENEQRLHWEGEARRRKRVLEETQQAVFSAKLSRLREVNVAEQTAFHKAKRAYEEAETKLKVIKQWDRTFEHRTEPLARQLEKLQTILSNDMVKAVAYLSQAMKTLEAYSGMMAPSAMAAQIQTVLNSASADAEKAEKQSAREAAPASHTLPLIVVREEDLPRQESGRGARPESPLSRAADHLGTNGDDSKP